MVILVLLIVTLMSLRCVNRVVECFIVTTLVDGLCTQGSQAPSGKNKGTSNRSNNKGISRSATYKSAGKIDEGKYNLW